MIHENCGSLPACMAVDTTRAWAEQGRGKVCGVTQGSVVAFLFFKLRRITFFFWLRRHEYPTGRCCELHSGENPAEIIPQSAEAYHFLSVFRSGKILETHYAVRFLLVFPGTQ